MWKQLGWGPLTASALRNTGLEIKFILGHQLENCKKIILTCTQYLYLGKLAACISTRASHIMI